MIISEYTSEYSPDRNTDNGSERLHRLLKKGRKYDRRKLLILALYIVCALALYLLGAHYTGDGGVILTACREETVVSGTDMMIHVIDVGEGDCTLVQGGGANILIDAGGSDKGSYVADYLVTHGVYTLDLVICTHPHADHIGGMDEVISSAAIRAERVVMPAIPDELVPYTRAYERLLDAIDAEGCEAEFISENKTFSFGQLNISVYTPFSRCYSDDLNDWSLCARFECGSVSLLCCGDLTANGEAVLLDMGVPLVSTVYKASHHGSRYSNSRGFLDAVRPRYAYICCGRDNDFGHPSDRVLSDLRDMGAGVFRTDTGGGAVYLSDGVSVTLKTVPRIGSKVFASCA